MPKFPQEYYTDKILGVHDNEQLEIDPQEYRKQLVNELIEIAKKSHNNTRKSILFLTVFKFVWYFAINVFCISYFLSGKFTLNEFALCVGFLNLFWILTNKYFLIKTNNNMQMHHNFLIYEIQDKFVENKMFQEAQEVSQYIIEDK